MTRRSLFTGALAPLAAYTAMLREARAAGTSRAPKLTISKIKAVRMRGVNSRFVRVHTDQGLTGTGETLDTVGAEDIVNRHIGPSIEGRDPLDIEGIYLDLWSTFSIPGGISPLFMRGMGGPYLSAVSGVEMALWDLAGKAMGVPLYRLLGGRIRNELAVYFHSNEPQHAQKMIETTGVKAFKTSLDTVTRRGNREKGFDPGKIGGWSVNNQQIDEIVAHVGAMREAAGPTVEVALECHARYDVEGAIQIAKAVEQFRPMWLEEPVTSDNPEVMALIRRSTGVPIACGENVYTRYGFRPFLEKQAVSVIQPDMAKSGGLLEGKKIAAMAEVYSVPVAPHGVATTLGKTAYAHVCSTIANFRILEYAHYYQDELRELTEDPDYKDGFVTLSERPGIGIEINEDAVKEKLEPGYEL